MSIIIKYRAIPMHCKKWVYGYYVYKPLADVHLIVSECTVPYKTETFLEETIVRHDTVQQLHHSWWRGVHYRNCNIPFELKTYTPLNDLLLEIKKNDNQIHDIDLIRYTK